MQRFESVTLLQIPMNLLLPKTYVKLRDIQGGDGGNMIEPVIFLAGPIRGAGDWQKTAIKKLHLAIPNALIVCPCRYDKSHELYKHRRKGSTTKFESQTEWERHYLNHAARTGVVMFWIPKEDPINPRPREEGPYAQDTYGELGEWRGRMLEVGGLNVVIGAEPDGLPGLSVIKKNYKYALNMKLHETLDSTLKAAVDTVNQRFYY